MHPRGVLIEPRRDLVLGFLDRDAVDMVDPLADRVVVPEVRRTRERLVPRRHMQRRHRGAELIRRHRLGQLGHGRRRRGRGLVVLPHHHPPNVGQYGDAVLVHAVGAQINDPGIAARIFAQAEDFGGRRERVAGIDGRQKAAIGIAEVRDRIERDVRHRLAEDDVEDDQIVDRRRRVSDRAGERRRGLHGKPAPVEPLIDRRVALGDRARRRVGDHLPNAEAFEIIARTRLLSRFA